MAYRNKLKQAESARRHYDLNKNKCKIRARIFTNRQTQILREYISEFKRSNGCADCKNVDDRVLDFHHLSAAEKVLEVSTAAFRGWSLAKLKQEISKCAVLCANCHRIREWEKRQIVPKDVDVGSSEEDQLRLQSQLYLPL